MNCAWCGANDDGSDSHGICEDCSVLHFGVNPVSVLQDSTDGEEEEDVQQYNQNSDPRSIQIL